MDYIDRIADLGACAPAMAWLRSEQYPSLQAAWDACPRGDWMLWLLHKHADGLYRMARFGHISDVAYAAADAARAAAYDAADAAYAAADAARDAVYYAARDAYAAYDAARDAIRDVVYDAARDVARAAEAAAIRAVVPVAPTLS